jgi:GxxExxY protein
MIQHTLPDKPRPLTGPNVIFPELSYEVMSVVYEVHNQLGPGYPEEIYQRAAAMEFSLRNIPIEEQKVIPVFYKGKQMGTFRLDMVVDGKIILEFKAVSELNDLFKQQTLSYLKATDLKLGILINFGAQKVEYVRIAY